jgi:protein TonB
MLRPDGRTEFAADESVMPKPNRAARFPGNNRRTRFVAFAMATVIELVLALIAMRHAHAPRPPEIQATKVELLSLPRKPPDPPPPAPPVPAPPDPKLVLPAPPVILIEAPRPPPVAAAPPQSATPLTIPPPPPPPPPAAQLPGVEDAFKAAVRAAVFAAYRVPAAARLLEQYGETRVAFVLEDGRVGDARIVASSGHETLDQAALAAVRSAQYPAVPEALRGRGLAFEIVLYNRRGGGP